MLIKQKFAKNAFILNCKSCLLFQFVYQCKWFVSLTNWMRSDEPNEVPPPAPHPWEVELLSVQWLSRLIFYRITEKMGGATKLLNSSHWRGPAFSLFLLFHCTVHCEGFAEPPTPCRPPPPFCPTWGVRRRGGRSHRLSANSRIRPHPAGWNGPIKIKRFKPNRYTVNVVGSKVRRNSQTWLAA